MQSQESPELYELYTRRELTLRDAREAAPGLAVEGNDGDGTSIRLRDGARTVLELDEGSLDVSLDFVDFVKDASGHDELPFCYHLRWPGGLRSAPAGDRGLTIAETLAHRCEGIIASFFERVVWPVGDRPLPEFDPDLYDIPEETFPVVHLRWFVRESVRPDPVAAWMRAVERVAPEWLPTEYTGRARMLALSDATIGAADDRRRADDHGVYLTGPEPIGTVALLPCAPEETHGMYRVACAAELDALDETSLDRLHEVFVAVADELGAELALAEVLENWDRSYDGSTMPGPRAQNPQGLGVGDALLAGLPMRPVPWCYLGPAYERLLADFLADAPATWGRRRTARGLDVRLSRSPVGEEDLPSDWFPAEFCLSLQPRWFHDSVLHGAATAPDWT
jgi:hypothetical protein